MTKSAAGALRELTCDELDLVSGGDIVVVAPRSSSRSGHLGGGTPEGMYFLDTSFDANDYGSWCGLDNPEIVVTGPPHMATRWNQLSVFAKGSWLIAYWYSEGNEQYADVVTHTDISGKNPDNPYKSTNESLSNYNEMAKDSIKEFLDNVDYIAN